MQGDEDSPRNRGSVDCGYTTLPETSCTKHIQYLEQEDETFKCGAEQKRPKQLILRPSKFSRKNKNKKTFAVALKHGFE